MESKMIQISQMTVEDFLGAVEERVSSLLLRVNLSNSQTSEKEIYTKKETAELLGVSDTTLYLWNKQGVLKHNKIGNRVYYPKDVVFSKLQGVT